MSDLDGRDRRRPEVLELPRARRRHWRDSRAITRAEVAYALWLFLAAAITGLAWGLVIFVLVALL